MSSLEKLYNGDTVPTAEYKAFSMLQDERKSFQLAVECENSFFGTVDVASDFAKTNIYSVESIKSDFPIQPNGADDYHRLSEDGMYPDLLRPLEKNTYEFKKGINVIWIELIADDSVSAGEHAVTVEIRENDKVLSANTITAEVISCKLDFKNFINTTWFHTDCLMSHYKTEAFSDEYWRIVKNFLETARDYGMNCVITPLFTPPLDTEVGKERPTVQLVDVTVIDGEYSFNFDKLTKWIDMAQECGIEYFEMSHFYTQWGAKHAPKIMATVNGEYKRIFGWDTKASSRKYVRFLTAFSAELKSYLEERGLKDKTLIHVSDEPDFPKLIPYTKASKTIHKLFDGYKIIDALSDFRFFKWKIVTTPIPANTAVQNFIGKTDELWTYYCSAQNKKYVSNRFFCMPSVRNRIIGYQMYKYDVKGFLHWGLNFYYTQFSKGLIDPYKVSDAGGKFPSGDSYVVYPAEDGTAYPSLRLLVFYDGLQDMAALNALEKLIGKEKALAALESDGENCVTFTEYPHSEEWLLKTREKINALIKENIK